jgi:hypothetical protein
MSPAQPKERLQWPRCVYGRADCTGCSYSCLHACAFEYTAPQRTATQAWLDPLTCAQRPMVHVVDLCGECFDADINIATPLFVELTGRRPGPNPSIAVGGCGRVGGHGCAGMGGGEEGGGGGYMWC